MAALYIYALPREERKPKMTKTRVAAIGGMLLLLGGVTGCSSASPQSFSSVEELKVGYVKAGGDCSDWKVGTVSGTWAQFGTCFHEGSEPDVTISIYSSDEDLKADLDSLKSRKGERPRSFVGPNWIITTGDPESIGLKMGATIVTLETVE